MQRLTAKEARRREKNCNKILCQCAIVYISFQHDLSVVRHDEHESFQESNTKLLARKREMRKEVTFPILDLRK